jgi:hypothetical protein
VTLRLGFALGVSGAVLGLGIVAGCGGGGEAGPTSTTGADALIKDSTIVGKRPTGGGPYEHPNAAADVYTYVTPLGGDRYRLEVMNTSTSGFINKFTWFPGPGTTILAVTSTRLENGRGKADCRLISGKISCDLSLRPPKCTCRGDGGTVAIGFTAKPGRGVQSTAVTFGGDLFIEGETLVPYFIPSAPDQKPSDLADIPICADGQVSTDSKPCLASR